MNLVQEKNAILTKYLAHTKAKLKKCKEDLKEKEQENEKLNSMVNGQMKIIDDMQEKAKAENEDYDKF